MGYDAGGRSRIHNIFFVSATEDSEEYFLRATQWLIPVSRRVKMELETASVERRELLFTNLQWTSALEVRE